MNASRMQEWLSRAATELGVRIEIGYAVRLSSGRSVTSEALFPHLGGKPRVILVSRWEDGFQSDGAEAAAVRDEIHNLGFATSTFGEPLPNEQFDVRGYAEMFQDWGWSGPSAMRPRWMKDNNDS